ncbi:MAG: hypothetical protein WCP68_09880 [Enhydrobacter sp.]
MHTGVKQSPVFCADSDLGDQRNGTKFEHGRGLATLRNGIGDAARDIAEHARREVRRFAPVAVELRGIFSGDINVGRLYLRV